MSDLNAPRGASAPDPSGQADRDVGGQDALAGVLMETQGPYEARLCKDLPADCCDYAVVSLGEMREVCRVWREQDARAIAAVLASPPVAVVADEAVEAALIAYFSDPGDPVWPKAYDHADALRDSMRKALEAAAPHMRAVPEENNKLDTYARKLFLRAADERCLALNAFTSAMQSIGRGRAEAKNHAARNLEGANARYEAARSELITEIERLDPPAAPTPPSQGGR